MKTLRNAYIDEHGNIVLYWSTGYVGWLQIVRMM